MNQKDISSIAGSEKKVDPIEKSEEKKTDPEVKFIEELKEYIKRRPFDDENFEKKKDSGNSTDEQEHFDKLLSNLPNEEEKAPLIIRDPMDFEKNNSKNEEKLDLEKAFYDNYRKTLESKMNNKEIEREIEKIKIFFDWLSEKFGVNLFGPKEKNIIVNVHYESAKKEAVLDTPRIIYYKPADNELGLQDLELRLYFDPKKHKEFFINTRLDLNISEGDELTQAKILESKPKDIKSSGNSNENGRGILTPLNKIKTRFTLASKTLFGRNNNSTNA